jgi:hypothetical protein
MSSATKSKVSAMVSGAGMAADVWTRLDRAVKAQGGNDEDLHLLARDEGQPMIDQIASMLVRAGAATRNVYPVVIDYGQTIDQMIEAGKYDYRNDNITVDNFPITGEGKVTSQLVLVHFNRDISSEDAVKEMAQMGLEPAKTEHLLAYGAQHWKRDPELVVALGSSWVDPDGDRSVPCLDGSYEDRRLSLRWWDDDWDDYWRFLAVRKS